MECWLTEEAESAASPAPHASGRPRFTLLYNFFFLSFLLCGVEGKPWLACADCKHLSEPKPLLQRRHSIGLGTEWFVVW